MDSLSNLFVHRENDLWSHTKPSLPVTLVTGFLGAGKTTLLQHIMQAKENLNIALAINDFNDIMQKEDAAEVVGLNGGCSCCSLVEDMKTKVSFLHSELVEKGRISYLVIETSGITDPRNIVDILDQNFDCVVTVVDADSLYHSLRDEEELEAAARSQIVNSDVILINKIDLIEEESLAYVKEKIPLPFIFDIEDKANLTQGVSHDRSHVMYQISAKGKGHRKEKTLAQPQKHTKGHVHEHSFNNVVVESTSPVVLWKFQEFLKLLDARVVRVKGTLFFSFNTKKQFLFHLRICFSNVRSGRQRYEIVDNGAWDSDSYIHLVFIGRTIDTEKIKEDFLKVLDTPEQSETVSECLRSTSAKTFAEILEANKMYEVQAYPQFSNLVQFRLTGYALFGMSKEQAVNVHGVNLNKMNDMLLKSLNSASGTWFFAGQTDTENQLWLLFEQVGTGELDNLHKLLSDSADRIVDLFYGNICGCKRHW